MGKHPPRAPARGKEPDALVRSQEENGGGKGDGGAAALSQGRTPRTIGKYEIVEKIATGGFGTVYEAWDPMIRRAVAPKTCEVPDANVRARVFREARLAGSLQHPNITTIYEFGEEGIVPFLVQ